MVKDSLDLLVHSLMVRDAFRRQAVGFSEFDEIRKADSARRIGSHVLAREVCILCRADRQIAVVVQDENFDRQSMMNDRLKFLDIEVDAPVPCNADDPLFPVGETCTNRCRQIIAHRSTAGVGK